LANPVSLSLSREMDPVPKQSAQCL